MNNTILKTLFTLLLFSIFLSNNTKIHVACQKYSVHIANNLPNNASSLDLQCQSKDDDVGFHILQMYEEFHWEFYIGSWETSSSVYSCQFWWAERNKSFVVFHHDIAFRYCTTGFFGLVNDCYWYVKEDGFYLSNSGTSAVVASLPSRHHKQKKMIDW